VFSQANGDQATKGTRWMPRCQEAMKDVVGCDKPRGAVKQAWIRGSPNGETHLGLMPRNPFRRRPTRGTETSKYPEERKAIATPQVAASERGIAQTDRV
jgi:hypothetical protein